VGIGVARESSSLLLLLLLSIVVVVAVGFGVEGVTEKEDAADARKQRQRFSFRGRQALLLLRQQQHQEEHEDGEVPVIRAAAAAFAAVDVHNDGTPPPPAAAPDGRCWKQLSGCGCCSSCRCWTGAVKVRQAFANGGRGGPFNINGQSRMEKCRCSGLPLCSKPYHSQLYSQTNEQIALQTNQYSTTDNCYRYSPRRCRCRRRCPPVAPRYRGDRRRRSCLLLLLAGSAISEPTTKATTGGCSAQHRTTTSVAFSLSNGLTDILATGALK
jgi:hypothetical protein